MTKHDWSLVFGLIMVGLFAYTAVVALAGLRTGRLLIPMRGSRTVEVTRQRSPIAFWFYFSITIVGMLLCAAFAYHFLTLAP